MPLGEFKWDKEDSTVTAYEGDPRDPSRVEGWDL